MAEDAGAEGPLGVTFAATDILHASAPVRLVVVKAAVLPSPALAERTLREWKQLAKVTSPRVLKIVDQGRLDDGTVYIASARPAGRPLDELISAEGPLSIERVKRIVAQIGEALTEAQKLGVIHRDVSPHNIHVDGDDVTVAEFGLAEAVTDKVFGTPAFLSPEQAEGKPVDQRSNIYSLGAVVYYMLTGVAPFEGDASSLLSQHASSTPPQPSSKRPGLPAELDRIVMKALEKSGGRRHLTLRQLVTEIEAVSAGGAVVRSEDLGSAKTLAPAEQQPPASPEMATVLGMAAPTMEEIKAAAAANAPKTSPQQAAVAPASAAATPARTATVAPAPAPAAPLPAPPAKTAPVVASAPLAEAKTMMGVAPDTKAAPAPAPPVAPVAAPVVAAAATVMAEAPRASAAAAKPAPAPVVQAQKKPAGFRETAWFKQGEIEEELAKAQAAAATADPLAPTGTTGKHATVDPAMLDAQDSRRLSLKTGATQMMQAVKAGSGASQALPGERMDEADMLAEMDRSKRWFAIAGAIVLVAVIALVVVLATRKSEPDVPKKEAVGAPKAQAPAPAVEPVAAKPVAEPPKKAELEGPAQLAEAETALGKGDLLVAIDSLLRASRAGAEPQKVTALAVSTQKALAASAVRAKKKKDRAGEAEARTLSAKLEPLLPAAPRTAKKPTSRPTGRRR